jgi:hypothetical protein
VAGMWRWHHWPPEHSIHYQCIRKICRLFFFTWNIPLWVSRTHFHGYESGRQWLVRCEIGAEAEESFYKREWIFYIWIRAEAAELVEHTIYITPQKRAELR